LSIGYACLLIGQVNASLSSCRIKYASFENIRRISSANLSALKSMIDYNRQEKIHLFRISSDIIPFASHQQVNFPWQEEFGEALAGIGDKIKEGNLRVSMHPGQYTILNSPHPQVVHNAVADLKYHAEFLDALAAGPESKIILHLGGIYGDKKRAIRSFKENYLRLPEKIKRRLALENDDSNYNLEEVLIISRDLGIPVVFDHLHHQLNPSPGSMDVYEWIHLCCRTWDKSDGKPKIHYSQGRSGGSHGAHSNSIKAREFLDFYYSLPDKNIDIMLEVKDKNLSVIKCINILDPNLPIDRLKREWTRYQYLILSQSAGKYKEIKEIFKQNKGIEALSFYYKIDMVRELPEDREQQVIAAQLIWSKLKLDCSLGEKKRYQKLLQGYIEGKVSISSLKRHLFKSARKQNNTDMLKSYYFYL
jgi:UV DNA damage endonuclease